MTKAKNIIIPRLCILLANMIYADGKKWKVKQKAENNLLYWTMELLASVNMLMFIQ